MFVVIYLAGMITAGVIRGRYVRRRPTEDVAEDRNTRVEGVLMALWGLTQFLPVVVLFTPWLDGAAYPMPPWGAWIGVALLVASLWLMWRSHADLGANWAPTVQTAREHTLITRGVYGRVRHPMYAAFWLMSFAQALLVPNVIAGAGAVLWFGLLYLVRVPREEQLMLDTFGEPYAAYQARTGRVIPRWR